MKINRHNFEEYFILYWDNELPANDRQMVDDFVKLNSDLETEFRLIGNTRFSSDNSISFKNKEFLLNDAAPVNLTNLEEHLLSYVDNELTAEQKREIEDLVSTNLSVQRELSLLQKVKLQPEAEISFPDKSILYRREERTPVIRMTWFRVAVAAALILIAGFATFRIINNNRNTDNVVPIAKKSDPVTIPLAKEVPQKEPMIASTEKEQLKNKVPGKTEKPPVPKQAIENAASGQIASNKPENKNNLPKEGVRATESVISSTIPAETDVTSDYFNDRQASTDALAMVDQKKKNKLFDNSDVTDNTIPTYTVYNELKEENNDGGGLKEFLRKTTRFFERRTKIQTTTEDNKLLVGAFAVSLK